MSAVFEALVQKLFFAGAPELSQILEIPGVKHVSTLQFIRPVPALQITHKT